MTVPSPEPIQAAVILPAPIAKRLDQLVRLGVGESRESLVNEALDEYLVATERRLDRKRHALALQGIQPGTQEWEASFQQLEQIARTTHVINDEKMEYLASETLSEIREEE